MQHDASTDEAVCEVALDAKGLRLAALLERISNRDAAAFETLYRMSAPSLVRLAVRVTQTSEAAEDVVQDGFIKIWRSAGTYDPEKSSPSTWMSAIVKNQALDYLRRSPYAGVYVEEFDERTTAGEDFADPPYPSALDIKRLSSYLGCLAPVQRQAIALAYFRGQSQSEIARTLNAPIGSVKSWIRRGLESLRIMADAPHVPGHGELY